MAEPEKNQFGSNLVLGGQSLFYYQIIYIYIIIIVYIYK